MWAPAAPKHCSAHRALALTLEANWSPVPWDSACTKLGLLSIAAWSMSPMAEVCADMASRQEQSQWASANATTGPTNPGSTVSTWRMILPRMFVDMRWRAASVATWASAAMGLGRRNPMTGSALGSGRGGGEAWMPCVIPVGAQCTYPVERDEPVVCCGL